MSYIYNLTDTWNAVGTSFDGIKMAITNTASASGSYMINLTTSGATTGSFTVDKSGNVAISGNISLGTVLSPANGGTGIATLGAGRIPYGNGTNAFNSSSSFVFDGTNLGIGTNTPSTYNGLLNVKSADRATIGYFGGTTYAVRFGANANYATIEGVDAATGVSSYQPLNINGSTLSLATGGTTREYIDASGNVYYQSGNVWVYQPAPTSKSTTATLSAAEVQTGIINTTGTTYTVTLPTGTQLDTAFAGVPAVDLGFDFSVINTASGTITIAVGASGMTSLGTLTIATGDSARFRLRRTAANTYILYRLA